MSRPNLSIIPSSDAAFREHLERLAKEVAFGRPAELEERLRRIFPRVVVRRSEVSGQGDTWYIYRDGVWRSSTEAPWWSDDRSPRLAVTKDGWIEAANAPARAILGLAAGDALPRHYADFAAPGALQDTSELFDVIAGGRELEATILIRPTSGDVVACDLRAWIEGHRIVVAFRLADDIPSRPAPPAPERVALHFRPSGDAIFARYADESMGHMAEPTPDGLELRLRRLYPHARVEPGAEGWTVSRDPAGAVESSPDQWWRAPGLATVRYDGQGRIIEANAEAERLLGSELVGRHWQELVTAGTTTQVGAVLRLIAEAGWAVSRFRMPGPDGYLFEFDSYTEVNDGIYLTIMRPSGT